MENNKKKKTVDPLEEERKAIEWENNVLKYLLPATGLAGFIVGLFGFIATISTDVPVGIFFLIIIILSLGGIAYGVYHFIKKIKNKLHKEIKQPDGGVQ